MTFIRRTIGLADLIVWNRCNSLGLLQGNWGPNVATFNLDQGAVDRIIDAVSIDDAWSILQEKVQAAGFDRILYGSNRLRRVGDFGDAADSFFLSDLPDALVDKLVNEELYRHLPVAVWAMKNKGVVSLKHGSDLYHSGQLSGPMEKTQKLFMDAGITGGYVISFNEPGSAEAAALSVMSLGASQEEVDDLWQRHGCVLQTYGSLFNLRISSLPVPLPGKALTDRQKEVLHWIAQGKTTNEIATILNLSVATIEKHLRHAREAFSVNTTLQAVLYAQITSQIFTKER